MAEMMQQEIATGRGVPRKRAVIIESQRLFVPFLRRAVSDVGADVLLTAKRPHARVLQTLQPDIVVMDASHLSVAPLAAIRTVRRAVPNATIVVYAAVGAPWPALARALGASVILGAECGGAALREAVAAG